MRLIDLSQPVYDACPHCPDDPDVRSGTIATHDKDRWQVELLSLTSHTGSHVDAPLHRIPGGAAIDQIPLERWMGQAFIADLRDCPPAAQLGPDDLAPALSPLNLADRIVLLATGWGQRRAPTDAWLRHGPQVTPAGANWLADRGVRGVGIDYWTIGGGDTHDALLSRGIWIVEELAFPPDVFIPPQPLEFWCLPIHLRGHSGAFCRPVVVVRDPQISNRSTSTRQ